MSLRGVCSALVTFFSYPIPHTFKCFFVQAAHYKPLRDPFLGRAQNALPRRFCFIPLLATSFRKTSTQSRCSFAQDDTGRILFGNSRLTMYNRRRENFVYAEICDRPRPLSYLFYTSSLHHLCCFFSQPIDKNRDQCYNTSVKLISIRRKLS